MSTVRSEKLYEDQEPELLVSPQGVYEGSPEEALGKLITTQIGIGIFTRFDLKRVAGELKRRQYEQVDTNYSTVQSTTKGTCGKLHRYTDQSLTLYQTSGDSGYADFYWPLEDVLGQVDGFEFDPDTDLIIACALGVRLEASTTIITPGSTWRQLSTDPNRSRRSLIAHYFPAAEQQAA